MENGSRQRKEFKNKQQEGHVTQTNIGNRTDSTTDRERCRARTPGLSRARAPTQEVRQSLAEQGGSTGSLLAQQRFPRVGGMETAQEQESEGHTAGSRLPAATGREAGRWSSWDCDSPSIKRGS